MKRGSRPTSADEARRLEEAADWLLRLRQDAADEAEIMRWVEWCESDPRNQQAFERAQAFWRLSGALAPEVVQGELRVERCGRLPLRDSLSSRWSALRASLREQRPALALAAVLVAVVAGAAAWNLRGVLNGYAVQDHDLVAAAVAERVRHAQLSDGSRVQLAAKSTLAVQYSERERRLELRDGEAYFTVAPNAERPFVVSVGEVRVRAVGTAFNVRRAGERIVVTVAEGTVDVYRDEAADRSSRDSVRIEAGSEVAWDARARQAPVVAAVNPAEALSWRQGRLEYRDEPLSAVIADFNRYSRAQAVIATDAVGDMRFTGTLLTDVTGEWIHALPRLFPVMVREVDGRYVIDALYQPRS